MLSPAERDEVVELLLVAVAGTPSPRATISGYVGNEFARLLPINLTTNRELVNEALRLCIGDGYGHDPTWLASLLIPIDTKDPVPRILARLANRPPPPPDPFEAKLLRTDLPFVNRSLLRDRLRVLQAPDGLKRVLVVSGPPRSGKSYSRELIDHLCGPPSNVLMAHVPLLPGQEAITGAREVAWDLVAQMGRPLTGIPTAQTDEDRWARELATWVLSEATNTQFDWWLVLDGFKHPDLRSNARKLIVHLADQVNNGVFARRCRLILIDFDRTNLATPPGRILVENVDPDLDSEVAACVTAILQRTGRNADAAQVTAAILAGLPAGEARLPALNQKLTDLLELAEGANA